MAEQQQRPDPVPLHFVQHLVYVMEGSWPEVTTFTPDMLINPHVYHATYDDRFGLLTFDVFNGGAQYTIEAEPAPNGRRIGVLVPGSDKKTTRRP
jgi:hypothetical protein